MNALSHMVAHKLLPQLLFVCLFVCLFFCLFVCVSLLVDPPEYRVNDTFIVREGDLFMITLELDANPIPGDDNFTWSLNGRNLIPMPGLVLGVSFIDLTMVTRLDEGNYTIVSTNIAGSGNASFQLFVERKHFQ